MVMSIASEARGNAQRLGLDAPTLPLFEALQPAAERLMRLMEESMSATKALQRALRHGARTDFDTVRTYHIAVHCRGVPVFDLPRQTWFVPGSPLLVLDFRPDEQDARTQPSFVGAYLLPWEEWQHRLCPSPALRTRQLAMLARMTHDDKLRALRGINGRF